MRLATDAFGDAVVNGGRPVFEVTSWLGSTNLGPVEVVTGTWTVTDAEDEEVPGQVSFSVPNSAAWRPTSPDHPLGRFGQQLQIRAGYDRATGPEFVPLGWFRIMSVVPNDEVLQVDARGLMINMQRARLLSPFTAAKNSTRRAAITMLTKGILPVSYDLADEQFPGGTWEEDRLGAMREIVQGWPGRVYVDDDGVLVVGPGWSDTLGAANVNILDGPGGTLRNLEPSPVTENEFNAYKVSTVPEGDESPVSEVAYLRTGPMRWGGPYGYNPGFYASPLLKPVRAQLQAVAQAMVQRARRRVEQVEITATPDYRIELGDIVRARSTRQGWDGRVRVVKVQHSRTATVITGAYSGSAL